MSDKETELNRAYEAVLELLEKDTVLNQIEYELVDFVEDDKGVTFYYDYFYRGIPITFNNLKKDYGLTHPMEVSVTSSTVTSYKRLMSKPHELVIQGNPFRVRYQKPLDALFEEFGDGVIIEDMYMGYNTENISAGAYLQWVVETPEERRLYELE